MICKVGRGVDNDTSICSLTWFGFLLLSRFALALALDNWYPTVAQKWGVPLDSRHVSKLARSLITVLRREQRLRPDEGELFLTCSFRLLALCTTELDKERLGDVCGWYFCSCEFAVLLFCRSEICRAMSQRHDGKSPPYSHSQRTFLFSPLHVLHSWFSSAELYARPVHQQTVRLHVQRSDRRAVYRPVRVHDG